MEPWQFAAAALVLVMIGVLLDNIMRLLLRGEEAPDASQTVEKPPERQPNLHPIGHLWEDPQGKSLVIEVDGETFRDPGQMSAVQRERLALAAVRLKAWLREGQAEAPAPAVAAAPGSQQAGQADAGGQEPVKPARPGWKAALSQVGQRPQPLEIASIAQQVDEVLQEMLPGSPFDGRRLSLTDAPDQGILVLVDGMQYDGVEAVPEEAVRQFLKEAVAEWRRRTMG